ncbi:MAG TPA: trypsin-like peptidase domain-containing protein [Pirellulales bacterium]|nr:trypsin-like peptidase domain-containing protein [Pirellulales bacterium]
MLLLLTAPADARAELIWPFSSLFRETSPGLGELGAAPPSQVWTKPHPSVVRVIVPERGGATSYGSGTLVDVHDRYGLVITNYHVVSDATGPATVLFPDGFQTAAQVVKVDRDWDLAALAIWRPEAAPVPIASQAVQPGEAVVIAGYGQGPYRAAAGRCVQYLSPDVRLPSETVEVSVAARQGDSGGPILNSRGELAGVLWGSGGGRTEGSYCGRVRQFLASIIPSTPDRGDGSAIALAGTAPSVKPGPSPTPPRALAAVDAEPSAYAPAVASRAPSPARAGPSISSTDQAGAAADETPRSLDLLSLDWQDLTGNTRLDQAKTLLAAVGIVALAIHFRRLLVHHP